MKTISKYVLGLITVLTLIFGVHSCNEDSINNTGENIVRKEIEYSEFEPNLNNSYNYIGELHNEIIHSFVTDYSDDELSIEEIISIVESIANANVLRVKIMFL